MRIRVLSTGDISAVAEIRAFVRRGREQPKRKNFKPQTLATEASRGPCFDDARMRRTRYAAHQRNSAHVAYDSVVFDRLIRHQWKFGARP